MAVISRNDPPTPPPPTFDIFGLTLQEMQGLKIVCDHAYFFTEYLRSTGKSNLSGITVDLATLFHAIRKAGI